MIGLLIFVVYAISAWYVLKQLSSRRAKTIVWAIIALTWGPALFVAFAPLSPSQRAEAAYVGKFIEVLSVVGSLLMPLTAIGLGIARAAAAPQSKHIVVGITVFLGFAVLFADEIAGRIYLSYLCANEAGVKVYRTVELPAAYWDEQGRARFIDEKAGGFLLGKEYPPEYTTGTYSTFFHVDNAGYKRIDKQSGKILGEVTDFRYWGGWMRRNLSPHNTANSCEGKVERSNSLIKQIFKPKKS